MIAIGRSSRPLGLPFALLAALALLAAAPAARAQDADSSAAAPPAAPPAEVRAWQTGLLRPDRVQHASLAWTLGLGAGLATREPAVAFATPAVLGLGKEIADRQGTGFDVLDLAADLIGAAAAGLLTTLWD